MKVQDEDQATWAWGTRATSRVGSAILLMVACSWIAYDSARGGVGGVIGALIVVLVCVAGWYFLALRPGLILSATDVVIVNPFRRTTIPLDDITGVDADGGAVRIRRPSGPTYAWAIQKWKLSIWLNLRVRADHVVDAINKRRDLRNRATAGTQLPQT